MRILLLLLAIAVLTVGCAAPISTQSDYDRNADFSSYRTFAWAGPMMVAQGSDVHINPFLEPRIQAAIVRNLSGKGFRQVDDPAGADLAIALTIGARDKIDVRTTPVTYRGYYGRGYAYGPSWGVSHGTKTEVRNYVEGALSIDIFDVKRREPVWYGLGTKRIYSTPKEEGQEQRIQEAVDAILASFPPGLGGG